MDPEDSQRILCIPAFKTVFYTKIWFHPLFRAIMKEDLRWLGQILRMVASE